VRGGGGPRHRPHSNTAEPSRNQCPNSRLSRAGNCGAGLWPASGRRDVCTTMKTLSPLRTRRTYA
jgi:hypothetical protein